MTEQDIAEALSGKGMTLADLVIIEMRYLQETGGANDVETVAHALRECMEAIQPALDEYHQREAEAPLPEEAMDRMMADMD